LAAIANALADTYMALFFFNVRFFAQLGEKPHIETEEQAASERSIRICRVRPSPIPARAKNRV
jgi:hypothetical protein